MTRFDLTIETDNAAFHPTTSDRAHELARILRDLAARLESDAAMAHAPDVEEYVLRDANGNRCGLASMRAGRPSGRMRP